MFAPLPWSISSRCADNPFFYLPSNKRCSRLQTRGSIGRCKRGEVRSPPACAPSYVRLSSLRSGRASERSDRHRPNEHRKRRIAASRHRVAEGCRVRLSPSNANRHRTRISLSPTPAGGSREHREPGLSNRNCRYWSPARALENSRSRKPSRHTQKEERVGVSWPNAFCGWPHYQFRLLATVPAIPLLGSAGLCVAI